MGPYNQAVLAGGWLYCSGQIPLDPETGAMVGEGDVALETRQVLKNLSAVLEAAGATADYVVRTTVFLADLGGFPNRQRHLRRDVWSGHKPSQSLRAGGSAAEGCTGRDRLRGLAR